MEPVSFAPLYDAWSAANQVQPTRLLRTVDAMWAQRGSVDASGFEYMATLRRALEALDRMVRQFN
jgi:hypothetical protein